MGKNSIFGNEIELHVLQMFPLGAEALRVEFDRHCSTERRHDPLTIMDATGRTVSVRSGNYPNIGETR